GVSLRFISFHFRISLHIAVEAVEAQRPNLLVLPLCSSCPLWSLWLTQARTIRASHLLRRRCAVGATGAQLITRIRHRTSQLQANSERLARDALRARCIIRATRLAPAPHGRNACRHRAASIRSALRYPSDGGDGRSSEPLICSPTFIGTKGRNTDAD